MLLQHKDDNKYRHVGEISNNKLTENIRSQIIKFIMNLNPMKHYKSN